MLTLSNLRSPKGAHRNIKRLGRGKASGQGVQAGKGHKGQKARAGGGVRPGFEGGQMPLYRRLAKRGFKNIPFKKEYAVLNLDILNSKFEEGKEINKEALISAGLLSGENKRRPVKILGVGAISKKLTFVGIDRFSKTAQDKIEKAGGSITIIEKGKK